MRSLLIISVMCLCLIACRYNRVSMKVKNISDYDFKKIVVRFGDSVNVFKDLAQGQVTPRFWANKNYGRGFTKIVLSNMDSLKYAPQDLQFKKMYYRGKLMVKVDIQKTKEQRDTIIIKTRRRFIF